MLQPHYENLCDRLRGAHRLKTSAAIGTVELTGLLMIATQAAGQYLAMATHRSLTMPARQPMLP